MTPQRLSALHHALTIRGARWVDQAGWQVADSFQDPAREVDAIRQHVGLQDTSCLGKIDLKGAGVPRFCEAAAAPADTTLLRLAPFRALLFTPPGEEHSVAQQVAEPRQGSGCGIHVTDVTSGLSALHLAGPKAIDLLGRVTTLDLRDKAFPNQHCSSAPLARVHVTLWRNDWGSLPAFRLLVSRDVAGYVWDAISDAGQSLGLVSFGLRAQLLLRETATD